MSNANNAAATRTTLLSFAEKNIALVVGIGIAFLYVFYLVTLIFLRCCIKELHINRRTFLWYSLCFCLFPYKWMPRPDDEEAWQVKRTRKQLQAVNSEERKRMARLQQEQNESLRKDQAIQHIFREQHELGDMSGSRSREDASIDTAEKSLLPPKSSQSRGTPRPDPATSMAMFQSRRPPKPPPTSLPFQQRSKQPFQLLPETENQTQSQRSQSAQFPWGERMFPTQQMAKDRASSIVEQVDAIEVPPPVRRKGTPPPLVLVTSNKTSSKQKKEEKKRFSNVSNMFAKRKFEKEKKLLRKEMEARQKLQRQRDAEQRLKEYELQQREEQLREKEALIRKTAERDARERALAEEREIARIRAEREAREEFEAELERFQEHKARDREKRARKIEMIRRKEAEQAEMERLEEERRMEEEERAAEEEERMAHEERRRRKRAEYDPAEERPLRQYGPGRLYEQDAGFEQPSPRQRHRGPPRGQPAQITSHSLPSGYSQGVPPPQQTMPQQQPGRPQLVPLQQGPQMQQQAQHPQPQYMPQAMNFQQTMMQPAQMQQMQAPYMQQQPQQGMWAQPTRPPIQIQNPAYYPGQPIQQPAYQNMQAWPPRRF